jgi:hypothetical protein
MHDHNVMLIGDICTTQTGSRTEASQEGQNKLRPSVAVVIQGNKHEIAKATEAHAAVRATVAQARVRHRVGAGTGDPGGCGSSGVLFGSGLAPPLHAFPFQESSGLQYAFPFALCWCGSRRPRGSVCGAHKQ